MPGSIARLSPAGRPSSPRVHAVLGLALGGALHHEQGTSDGGRRIAGLVAKEKQDDRR
jgi:hypothetical protein